VDATQINSISAVLAPSLAILLSIVTYVLTNARTQKIDDRAAAKETVELLVVQNNILIEDVKDLRARLAIVESVRDNCEKQLELMRKQLGLKSESGN